MRIQQFLDSVSFYIQNKPDIHLPTIKLIIKSFYSFLSDKEKGRWQYRINEITSYTTTQESIDIAVNNMTTKDLEKHLKELKKGFK